MKNFDEVKKKFPKNRTELDSRYKSIYEEHYKNNREGKGFFNYLSQNMESWMHRQISKKSGAHILEVGAGNLNHLNYEKNFKTYDVVEPFKILFHSSKNKKLVRNFFHSLSEINFKYDRIISIATLEHLLDLPEDIKLCSKLLNNNGILQVAIPCEGEAAFTIGWKLTTGIHFKIKYGLDYSKLMEHEHVNSLEEIMVILKNYFKITNFKRSFFILPLKNFSFYCYIECRPK